ncbi:helix-turn-helix domain-containing protein [Planctomycetota bacterium]
MITNERQHRINIAQREKLKKVIDTFDIKAATKQVKSKILAKAELEALQSEYENLSLQLDEYETLKSGAIEILKASTLEGLPSILIRARIAKGLSQRQLAEVIGWKEQQIQRYEAEEYASANLRTLTKVADALSLNISEVAGFRSELHDSIDEGSDSLAWDQFPVKEMYLRNWFEGFSGTLQSAVNNAEELVRNFVESTLEIPIQAAARQRVRSGGHVNRYALIAWQCRVIDIAKQMSIENKFRKKTITNDWLTKLAQLSCEKDGSQRAIEYLRDSGIRLVIEPHLSYTHLDGAAFLLSSGPIIGLTLRYDRLDNFWFVLFHELVHIMKHLHRGDIESIFDDIDAEANDIELEADNLAGEFLIPEKQWETALARYVRSEESIKNFANELGIHPAIIAGKIRKEADNYTILTDIVGQGEVRNLFPEVRFS